MDVRRDELDETSYQLMMDIQTGRALEPPQPRRRRKLFGMTLVALGGFVGLLLASGHLTSEPHSSGKPALLPSPPPAITPLPMASPDPRGLLLRENAPTLTPPAADIQPTPPPKHNSQVKGLAATPVGPGKSTSATKRPQRVGNAKRIVKRSGTEQPQSVLQQRSLQLWSRSPVYDFDPNAELVRSSP